MQGENKYDKIIIETIYKNNKKNGCEKIYMDNLYSHNYSVYSFKIP